MQSVKATVMETTAGAEDLLRASMQIAALTADDKVCVDGTVDKKRRRVST